MQRTAQLAQQLDHIYTTIEQACRRSHRNSQAVGLMAVTKYASDEDVLALLETGRIAHVGESRVQQAMQRWTRPEFAKYPVNKHFIGHLQRNKAAQAARLFDFIDSIDNIQIAQALSVQAQKLNKQLPVLVQIKLTQRETQSGVSLKQAPQLVRELLKLPHLRVCGYMAIAPQGADKTQLQALFGQVYERFESDFPADKGPRYLSLGMSEDFEVAIEAGSTLPRIGSKLFATHLEEL